MLKLWVREAFIWASLFHVSVVFQIHPSNALTRLCATHFYDLSIRDHTDMWFFVCVIVSLMCSVLAGTDESSEPSGARLSFTQYDLLLFLLSLTSLSSHWVFVNHQINVGEDVSSTCSESTSSTKSCVIRYLSAPLMRKVNQFWIFNEILSLVSLGVYLF